MHATQKGDLPSVRHSSRLTLTRDATSTGAAFADRLLKLAEEVKHCDPIHRAESAAGCVCYACTGDTGRPKAFGGTAERASWPTLPGASDAPRSPGFRPTLNDPTRSFRKKDPSEFWSVYNWRVAGDLPGTKSRPKKSAINPGLIPIRGKHHDRQIEIDMGLLSIETWRAPEFRIPAARRIESRAAFRFQSALCLPWIPAGSSSLVPSPVGGSQISSKACCTGRD